MTQVDTGQNHATQTDSDGRYALPSLPVGPYRMEVRRPDSGTMFRPGIVLVVNNNVTINVATAGGRGDRQD